jgi:hypothetical protein
MNKVTADLDGRDTVKLSLQVEGTPDAVKVLVNLLAAIQYNTNVGHSCTIGAYFDGDGADKLRFEGLPENDGKEMAEACGNYGDGLMAQIGLDIALAFNTTYTEDHQQMVRQTKVWPPEKGVTASNFLSRAKESK